jgi:hypothetical protein
MSKTTILNAVTGTVKNLKDYAFGIFDIRQGSQKIDIKAINQNTSNVKNINFSITQINFSPIQAKPNTHMPFRVRFTTIGEGREGIPPIGIAIIGYNNYIL